METNHTPPPDTIQPHERHATLFPLPPDASDVRVGDATAASDVVLSVNARRRVFAHTRANLTRRPLKLVTGTFLDYYVCVLDMTRPFHLYPSTFPSPFPRRRRTPPHRETGVKLGGNKQKKGGATKGSVLDHAIEYANVTSEIARLRHLNQELEKQARLYWMYTSPPHFLISRAQLTPPSCAPVAQSLQQ